MKWKVTCEEVARALCMFGWKNGAVHFAARLPRMRRANKRDSTEPDASQASLESASRAHPKGPYKYHKSTNAYTRVYHEAVHQAVKVLADWGE